MPFLRSLIFHRFNKYITFLLILSLYRLPRLAQIICRPNALKLLHSTTQILLAPMSAKFKICQRNIIGEFEFSRQRETFLPELFRLFLLPFEIKVQARP